MLTGRCWITLKNTYFRITLTRFTIAFFLFCFVHCFAEGFIQAFIFSLDSDASALVTSILRQAEVPRNNFGILHRHNGNATLELCNLIPTYIDNPPCELVYQTGQPNLPLPSQFNLSGDPRVFIAGVTSVPGGLGVDVAMPDGDKLFLSEMCTLVLVYPHQVLMNAQREDVVLVLTQFWIFCVSFFAIAYDSIPHLVAALCFRTLTTGWSMYIIWRTGDVFSRFNTLLSTPDSPCKDVKVDTLFPMYFESRQALQIPDLVMNVVSLGLAIYLSMKLIKVYGPNTFNRVGAPKDIIRIYKYFLAIFVSFQLAALLLISVVCLWLDQMLNRDNALAGSVTYHRPLYIALSIFTLAILVPWITMGWYAVRREWKRLMVVFLTIAAVVFASWILMLKSWSFAWTFVNWPFFACQIIAASLSLLTTIVFGVVCWVNMGKGLAHYLYVDDVLGKSGFEPELFENDVGKHPPSDWREIGLDDIPTYTLSFSGTEKRDLGDLEKQDVDRK
ncbi:hypothetical protein B0H10DRAFT_1148958 [Mycena sp. CBHHK59/15]|nr:hypothetical protein B0H10DRAFT_1148958 [Mycena sp. CBHHK59/15]